MGDTLNEELFKQLETNDIRVSSVCLKSLFSDLAKKKKKKRHSTLFLFLLRRNNRGRKVEKTYGCAHSEPYRQQIRLSA